MKHKRQDWNIKLKSIIHIHPFMYVFILVCYMIKSNIYFVTKKCCFKWIISIVCGNSWFSLYKICVIIFYLKKLLCENKTMLLSMMKLKAWIWIIWLQFDKRSHSSGNETSFLICSGRSRNNLTYHCL